MTRFKSARELEQHLQTSGSDVQVVRRRPARRNPERAAQVALAGRRQAHPEHDEQVKLVAWARANAGWFEALKLLFSIPNGGHRNAKTAALMKAEGVLAGVPDLYLACPRFWPDGSVSHGLFIEMKAKGGRLSQNQKAIISLLRERGYRVAVCYSAEEAKAEILEYLDTGGDEHVRIVSPP